MLHAVAVWVIGAAATVIAPVLHENDVAAAAIESGLLYEPDADTIAEPAEVDENVAPVSLPATFPKVVDQEMPLHAEPSGKLHVMLIAELALTFIEEGEAERMQDGAPVVGNGAAPKPEDSGIARAVFATPKRASTNNTENIVNLFFIYTTLSYFGFYLFIILVPV